MRALGWVLAALGLLAAIAFLALGAGAPGSGLGGQTPVGVLGLVLLLAGVALGATPREGPYPGREVASLAAAVVALGLAVACIAGAVNAVATRTLGVLAVLGFIEVAISATLALGATARDGAATHLLVPGVAISAVAGIFLLGTLVLGGV